MIQRNFDGDPAPCSSFDAGFAAATTYVAVGVGLLSTSLVGPAANGCAPGGSNSAVFELVLQQESARPVGRPASLKTSPIIEQNRFRQ
jgi:hypothetical protein